ncbi:hypothetical protein PN424_17595, partial [Halorubrum ezzemoulense]|nr:hypothetical protein [Halorubrum ezzemoulense]
MNTDEDVDPEAELKDWIQNREFIRVPSDGDVNIHNTQVVDCEYTEFKHASKCPSSRSPHRIRTGAVTWMLNAGIPPEVV